MKKAVITYNFGDYDTLKSPEWKDSDWDFYLFTDKPQYAVEGWETIEWEDRWDVPDDPKRKANYVKYNVFNILNELGKEVDVAIVMDANMVVCGPLDDFVNIFLMSSVDGMLLKHPNAESCFQDLGLCARWEKDSSDNLDRTWEYFDDEGYPEKVQDYFQTGLSIRRNSSGWRIIEEVFTKIYQGYTKRDQPIMNFVHWKYPVLDLNLVDIADVGEFIRYEKHHFEKDVVYS